AAGEYLVGGGGERSAGTSLCERIRLHSRYRQRDYQFDPGGKDRGGGYCRSELRLCRGGDGERGRRERADGAVELNEGVNRFSETRRARAFAPMVGMHGSIVFTRGRSN